MSTESAMNLNINVYEVMDFYADVFEVEKNGLITNDENTFDPDVVLFNNEINRYDKLKENGQVEIEKITKDIYQVEIH
ncbi:MAG: hypothetical protein ABS916_08050 [Carnobacterium sp.]|uniref:hypothetical protein n=1 Tax=Carnobacterium sp. TaxID=48221 RepID=UPI003315663C